MLEIEIKARLKGQIELYRLKYEKLLAVKAYSFEKRDFYYQHGAFNFRVRQDQSANYLTFKQKKLLAKGEVNRERETLISDFRVFELFLKFLKLEPLYEKTKQGYAFHLPTVLIELCQVAYLGLFIEIETHLEESASSQSIQEAQIKLKNYLELLGVQENQIEERTYQELLQRH